jgi:predicted enzyme related to lactoylglutathione lyase
MPKRDLYVQGTPSWVDLATTDLAAAKAFYTTVFGWDYDDQPLPDGGNYTNATLEGHNVAGMSEMNPEMAAQMPPVWSTYLAVDDVDAVAAKVPDAGGTIMMPAMDVMDAGRMAMITDPTGAAVGLWQAGSHAGAQLVNEPGTLIWNECFTDDVSAAAEFYDTILGTSHVASDMGGPDPYTTLNVGEDAVGGYMHRNPEVHAQVPNSWTVYFASADINDTVARINSAGGAVLNGPFPTPIGPMIVAADPQGAVFQAFEAQAPQTADA